ncbi:MAG: OmpA family protein [Candidatus Omnitrophica bacterium]|nr:OmpA family protein [Candidatus Omnitrophota bacterium]
MVNGGRINRTGHKILVIFVTAVFLSGCASNSDLKRINREQAATIASLNKEVQRLNQELDELLDSREDLVRAKSDLEQKLQRELEAGDLSVEMESRGLVVTVLDRVLFDSGKAELKTSAQATIDKVAKILGQSVGDNMVYVEGHTDNDPIRYSGWRSNWELSTGRALEVVHYFIDSASLDPERFVATGYGEFHPVESNATAEGKMKNRRVEIVISPKKVAKKVS